MADDSFEVRRREPTDLASVAAIAELLERTDGYPEFLANRDFAAFVSPDNALDGWVAVEGGETLGHVLLRTSSAPLASTLAADELGVHPGSLAFVSRLMVVPAARRRGMARRLLRTATAGARELGRTPVLDVLLKDTGAIALYEDEGWRRLGQTAFTMRDGTTFDELVFAAP